MLVAALSTVPACNHAPAPDGSTRASSGAGSPPAVSLLALLPTAQLSSELERVVTALTAAHDFRATGGTWRREGAEVHAEGLADGEPAALVRETPALGDGTLSVALRLRPSGGQAAAGLLFRLRDARNGFGVTVDDRRLELVHLRDGAIQTLAAADATVERDEWHVLRVALSGDRATVFLDDRRMLEASLPDAPAAGGIGLLPGRGSRVSFRDLAWSSGGTSTAIDLDLADVPAAFATLIRGSRERANRAREPWQLLAHTVELDDDFRSSLVVPPDSEIRLPVDAPLQAVLHFELGVLASLSGTGGSSRLRVGHEDATGARSWLWTQLVSAEAHARSWEATTLDLGAVAGRSGALVLRNEAVGPSGSFVALANPVLRSRAPAPAARRNLLLVTVDTLRADHLGAYGYPRETSPWLDGLAARSVIVDEVTAQSSWTKTSMASIFTATHPERHGVRGAEHLLPADLTTLAEVLEREGYFTAAVQTNPWLLPRFRMAGGFAEYHWLKPAPPAARVNERAIEILNRRPDQPWFLYLHYMDVHHPYLPPDGYRHFGTEPADLYDGEIRYLDDQLSGLHRTLADMGLLDHTLLVVTSDHGEEFGEHGGRYHGTTLYEEQLRVPLILSAPGQLPAGVRIAGPMQSLDLAPTILGLLDVPAPAGWEGTSWRDRIVSGATRDGDLERFAQTGLNDVAPRRDLISIAVGRWKLIKDRRSDWTQLFDRAVDPAEQNDLASVEVETRRRLEERVAAFLATHRPGRSAAETTAVDPAVARQLRALGYLQEPSP